MLNGKNISCKEIIYNVIRDRKVRSQDFVFSDLLEWAAECIDLIGSPLTLAKDLACIEIEDHRGKLPCNLHTIIQTGGMMSNGVLFPMREATNTFHPLEFNNSTLLGTVNTTQPITTDADGNPVFNVNNFDVSIDKQSINLLPISFKDVTYEVNSNYIYTSFKNGAKVLMSYKSFPIDKEGFPLIPDHIKFKQAVQWYIINKLDYQGWIQGKIGRDVFTYSETQRDWYIGAATTAANIPSIDGMETLKNQWLKMYQDMNSQGRMFDNLGNQQFLSFGQKNLRY
jgi:hypothetical protein